MADDTAGVKRLNYFNSQLLDEADFKAEQAYHLGMRRRHNRFVHTWGVAGTTGLQVTREGDKKIKIGAGMAIDSEGREIVLIDERTFTLDAIKARPGRTVFLTLSYEEVLELPVQDIADSPINFRRCTERPVLDVVDKAPLDDGKLIALAAIKLDVKGNISEIDTSIRRFVGSVIDPGSHLRVSQLDVSGTATVTSHLTVQALTVSANTAIAGSLRVDSETTLESRLSVGADATVAQSLSVKGRVLIGTVSDPKAALEINQGESNDIALKLVSSGESFGSGLSLVNAASGGHNYVMFSNKNGALVMQDSTPKKTVWIVDKGERMNFFAPLTVFGLESTSPCLTLDRDKVNAFALELTSSSPGFGSGLVFNNTVPAGVDTAGKRLPGGHRYDMHSRSDGMFIMEDLTPNSTKLIWSVDAAGSMNITKLVQTSHRASKKDISTLGDSDYGALLQRLTDTPLVRFRYRHEGAEQALHLGVVAEEAPAEIVDPDRQYVQVLDYLGFLFAGLKAQALELRKVKAALTAVEEGLKS